MKDELRQVWERYVRSWQVASLAEKRELYATCLAPACVYTDPLTRVTGWEQLAAYMLNFHEQVPGGHFVTQEFLAHHGRSVARWKMMSGAGAELGEGISYAEYDPQHFLVSMTGFFQLPASAESA